VLKGISLHLQWSENLRFAIYARKKSQYLNLVIIEIEQIDFIVIVNLVGLFMYRSNKRKPRICYN
jgi:hypothetical protein